jgi:hypothetical protein
LGGREPAGSPADAWKEVNFDDSQWETGPSGFGFGDNDDATILATWGQCCTASARSLLSAGSRALELTVDYDTASASQPAKWRADCPGPVTYQTLASQSHEAGTPETINLGTAGDWLQEGKNVLAIEGHNNSLTSSDVSLIPSLRTGSDALRNGNMYILATQTISLAGHTEAAGAARVMVGDVAADFNPLDGSWHADVNLAPGLNVVTAKALNADANELEAGSLEIVYVPPANTIAGELQEDVTLSGAYIVDKTLTVPAGKALTIAPGTVMLMKKGVSIVVAGLLVSTGERDPYPSGRRDYLEAAPVRQGRRQPAPALPDRVRRQRGRAPGLL